MSTQSVQVEVLGEIVTGEIVDTRMVADYGGGLRDEVTVDVDGARYCFDEDDVESR